MEPLSTTTEAMRPKRDGKVRTKDVQDNRQSKCFVVKMEYVYLPNQALKEEIKDKFMLYKWIYFIF